MDCLLEWNSTSLSLCRMASQYFSCTTPRRMWGSWMHRAPSCLASSGPAAPSSPDEEYRSSPRHGKRRKLNFLMLTRDICKIEGRARIACCLRRTRLHRIAAGRDACVGPATPDGFNAAHLRSSHRIKRSLPPGVASADWFVGGWNALGTRSLVLADAFEPARK